MRRALRIRRFSAIGHTQIFLVGSIVTVFENHKKAIYHSTLYVLKHISTKVCICTLAWHLSCGKYNHWNYSNLERSVKYSVQYKKKKNSFKVGGGVGWWGRCWGGGGVGVGVGVVEGVCVTITCLGLHC